MAAIRSELRLPQYRARRLAASSEAMPEIKHACCLPLPPPLDLPPAAELLPAVLVRPLAVPHWLDAL